MGFHTSHSSSTKAAVFSPACEGGKETGLGGTDAIWQEARLAPSLHLACLAPSLGPSWLQLAHCKGPVSSQSPSQLQSHDSLEMSPQASAKILLPQKRTLSNHQIRQSMHSLSDQFAHPLTSHSPEGHHPRSAAFSCSVSSIRLGAPGTGRALENRAHTHSYLFKSQQSLYSARPCRALLWGHHLKSLVFFP